MKQRTAGLRHAKTHLSELVRDVKEGHEWVICDRGVPVARLVPAKGEPEDLGAWLRRMQEIGMIETLPLEPSDLPLPIRLDPPDLAQRMLQEDRKDDHLGP
jgi:prevent-host-death family protein